MIFARVLGSLAIGVTIATAVQAQGAQTAYKSLSTQDFELDGKKLAQQQAKISVAGFYIQIGLIERLFPSMLAAATALQYGQSNSGVALISADASRDLRKYLLYCRDDPALSQVGCPVILRGQAGICENRSRNGFPCLLVENGKRAVIRRQ